MKKVLHFRILALWVVLLPLAIGGCAALIAKYDKVAYQQATSLKVESQVLMEKATQSYSKHKNDVAEMKIKIDKAYEYAKGRPKNEIITKQWAIMRDPDRNLLGGFLIRWKEKGTLSKPFITEAKKTIMDGFDQIIGLESGLIKPKRGR